MSTTLRALRWATLVGAVAPVLGAGTSSACWCGAASYRALPAPVVATQCNAVALAPTCQPATQTVLETVYENQPVTVMETRYRTAYRTEQVQVQRPVVETSQVERRYTVMKPVYQTVMQERRYTVMKPVVETKQMERRYTVMK